MPSEQEIQNQQELLAAHRQRLFDLLKEQALDGEYTAPPTLINIADARAKIRRVKTILRDWGIAVEDHPDDEE